jgi:hypothetical protein
LVGAFCPKCDDFIENIQFISIVLKAKELNAMPPVHAVELKSGMPGQSISRKDVYQATLFAFQS